MFDKEIAFIEAQRLPTPVAFFSEQRLVEPLNVLQHELPQADIYYALKSCYHPPLLRALSNRGIGVEVLSELELDLALRYGFTKVVLNGMGRSEALLRKAVACGAVIIIDTKTDIIRLKDIIAETGLPVNIGVRLSLKSAEHEDNAYLSGDHPLGNTLDSEFFQQFIAFCHEPDVTWQMLHAHYTINETRSEIYEMAIHQIADSLEAIWQRYAHRPVTINIGGGYEVYRPSDRQRSIDLFNKIKQACDAQLPGYAIAVEPGRYLSAYSGYTIGKVTDTKQVDDMYWLITDIGTNTLIPIPNARYELWLPQPAIDDASLHVGVTDGITSPANNIITAVKLTKVPDIGAYICIGNTGAYTDVYSTFWAYQPHLVCFMNLNGDISQYRTADDIASLREIFFKPF